MPKNTVLPPVNFDVTEWQGSELQIIREKEEKHQSRRNREELSKKTSLYQTDKDWSEEENRCNSNNKQKNEVDRKGEWNRSGKQKQDKGMKPV